MYVMIRKNRVIYTNSDRYMKEFLQAGFKALMEVTANGHHTPRFHAAGDFEVYNAQEKLHGLREEQKVSSTDREELPLLVGQLSTEWGRKALKQALKA